MIVNSWTANQLLLKNLKDTNKYLLGQVSELEETGHEELFGLVVDLINGGGKMLRPALVFLFNDLGDNPAATKDVEPVAGAMEILHLATLIHDDVLDNSPLRRHQTTVHAKLGNKEAIYAGDYLFSKFFEIIVTSLDNRVVLTENARHLKLILMGELNQLKHTWHINQTVANYLETVTGKTTVLFGLSSLNGMALAGGSEEECETAYEFGINLGIAFQIADDLRDFAPRINRSKPRFEDLQNGIFSLPVILALKNDAGNCAAPHSLQNLIDQQATENEIFAKIVSLEGVHEAQAMARNYLKAAYKNLQDIGADGDNQTLKQILKLVDERI